MLYGHFGFSPISFDPHEIFKNPYHHEIGSDLLHRIEVIKVTFNFSLFSCFSPISFDPQIFGKIPLSN